MIDSGPKGATQAARRATVAKHLSMGLATVLAILALAALGASYFSYATVLRIAIGSSSDDQVLRGAGTLLSAFHKIVVSLRLCSAGLGLAALLAILCRNRIQTWIAEALLPMPQFLRGVAGSVLGGLKADGKLNAGVLLGLFLLGVAFRVRFLFRPIRFDEADSFITFASRPLYIGLSWYPEPNNHLLQTLLMHFAWRFFGDHEWALRLPALFAGSLLIPMTYWAARQLYDKNSALIAAGMIAAASPLVGYSVEGRGYTILCVLFLLLVITTQYLIEHDSPPAWLLWVLIAALGFYTIPIMLYAVGTAALWLALSTTGMEPKRSRGQCLARLASALFFTGALTVLLYTPVLIVSGWRSLLSNPHVQSRTVAYLLANFGLNVSQTWRFWTTDVPLPLAFVFTAGFLIALLNHTRPAGHRVPVPLAAALCIPLLLLAQRVVPYARIWIFLLPLCAAVSAAGLWLSIRRLGRIESHASRVAAVAALGVFAFMSVCDLRGTSLSSSPLDGIENTVVWIQGHLKQGDTVMATGGIRAPLSYYFRLHGVPLVSRPAPCNPIAIAAYTFKGTFHRNPAGGETQFLMMTAGKRESLESFGACLTGPAPALVYERAGIRIFERIASGQAGQ